MIQQLTIDTFLNTEAPIKRLIDRWLMLDFLDGLKGSTAFIEYKDVFMSFRIPFRFGDFQFSINSGTSPEGDFVRLCQIRDTDSVLTIKHRLTGLVESEEGYQAIYTKMDFLPKSKHIVTRGLTGTAHFQLGDYSMVQATAIPTMTEHPSLWTVIREMTGKSVHLILTTPDDWLQDITSLPIHLEHISLEGNNLSLIGSQGTHFQISGVSGVRVYKRYLLFDVYNSAHGYSYSFYMASSLDLYKR
ncbi:hypothetical protein [Paenibacillus terrae]|uniref:Uncharacterized protein n=1 Tax=Paenibacillus terrae TaxID=159743 RepID=A0A0D7WYD4_9BACL|nr:hypothetical protein [Paenibacillus terrae]KJD43984.1 hypothetical protein QD47_19440 [Paenibacillus terrae]